MAAVLSLATCRCCPGRTAGRRPSVAQGLPSTVLHVLMRLGEPQDTYQQFQCQLSSQIAAEHPELSEQLCVEMLTRVLNVVNKVTRHQVLVCLPPWMQNLSFSGDGPS